MNFLRSINENKLHFPCIQYVITKIIYSVENAKHLALSGGQIQISGLVDKKQDKTQAKH